MRKLQWIIKPKLHVSWPHYELNIEAARVCCKIYCVLAFSQAFGHQLFEVRKWRSLALKKVGNKFLGVTHITTIRWLGPTCVGDFVGVRLLGPHTVASKEPIHATSTHSSMKITWLY